MEIEASYLEAIQAIAGTTPGEKQRAIHDIAKNIAEMNRSGGYSVDQQMQIFRVTDPLKPLVRVEIAKILHQYDAIIEALKSEDISVVSRALQAKWFFDGSDSRLVNANYFLENVFPEISLYARSKIVKRFGMYLKNTAIAKDFFLTLAREYGVGQATPLLVACEEDFAFKMIVENRIVLSSRMVETWFRKYPNLVIKYLMLSKPDDDNVRNLHRININDYEGFLPELANKRFEDFMVIYCVHDGMINVVLGKKATNIFLSTRVGLLLENPEQYLKLISLKAATQKLSIGDFAKMFKNLFPSDKADFRYSTINRYLRYFKSEQLKKIPLILHTFREVYGTDLLSCKNLIDSELLKVLPTEDRVKQARLKLKDDKDWDFYDLERTWRCYLPTSESVPAITQEMAKSSDASKRGQLLKQLIYTSEVNDDKDALLKILTYVYDRHMNDQHYIFYSCLLTVCDSFHLPTLSPTHWEILNKYIKLAEMRGEFSNTTNAMSPVIESAIHYCLLNSLPFDDYLRMMVNIKIRVYGDNWNVITNCPDMEKMLLGLFIEVIPTQYPLDGAIWRNEEARIITSLSSSLWDFNRRNKVSNAKLEQLSIRDYPWLLKKIKDHIIDQTNINNFSKERILNLLKVNERDLYYDLIRNLEEFWTLGSGVILDVLKVNPELVLDRWVDCFENANRTARLDQPTSSFITKIRWHQHLPIKFFDECLKIYKDPKTCYGSIAILALLTDGETYSKIIDSSIPNAEKIDVNDPEVKHTFNTRVTIASNFRKLNPPMSLDIIARFCVGDYLQMAMRSLTSVCRRVSVAKVIPFAKMLINRPVSVMKHGIRLIHLVAPLEEIYTCLTDLWNSRDHPTIRLVVFNSIVRLFHKQADARSWCMVRMCLQNLNTNDDEEIFKSLSSLSAIPNQYLYEYIDSSLSVLKSMEQKSDDPKLYVATSCRLIKQIDKLITEILPELYCQALIEEYLFVFDYNSEIFSAGMHLAVHSYLLSSKVYNEERLKYFGDFFRHSVQEYWDMPHPKCSKFYPINSMVRDFFQTIFYVTNRGYDVRIFESLLEIFQSALQPHQDAVSYLNLVYSIAYHGSETSVDFGIRMAQKIPDLIETFSPECVISMSNTLSDFVKCRTFCESESREEMLMAIIEVFVNSENIHCALFAVNMISNNAWKKVDERLNAVVHVLRDFHHPGILWFLNKWLAASGFREDNDD